MPNKKGREGTRDALEKKTLNVVTHGRISFWQFPEKRLLHLVYELLTIFFQDIMVHLCGKISRCHSSYSWNYLLETAGIHGSLS